MLYVSLYVSGRREEEGEDGDGDSEGDKREKMWAYAVDRARGRASPRTPAKLSSALRAHEHLALPFFPASALGALRSGVLQKQVGMFEAGCHINCYDWDAFAALAE